MPNVSRVLISINDHKVFTRIIKLFSSYVESGFIYFTKTGFYISGMDHSHTCLVKCVMGEDTLVYTPPEDEFNIGVSFVILHKILNSCSSSTSTVLKASTDNNILEISVREPRGKHKYKLSLIELDSDEMEVPEMDYAVERELDTACVKDAIDNVEKLGADTFTLTQVERGDLRIKYSTDYIEGDVVIEESRRSCVESSVMLSTNFAKGFISSGPYGPKTIISYTHDEIPVRFKCPLVGKDNKISERDYVEIHIAPRTTDDDED